MSVELVKEQIEKFLANGEPEVLAIKGAWGIGKTYSWNKFIEEFKETCKLKSYAYVSLFGMNSIDELKQSIFLNKVDIEEKGKLDLAGIAKNVGVFFKDKEIPYLGGISGIIELSAKMMVSEMIICFDDLERHGESLSIKDFMGLVVHLKEQKNCKIVLLLNEEAKDTTFDDYKKYKEKVIDKEIHFEDTAEGSFNAMVLEPCEFFKFTTRNCCVNLDIKNKRVIKKIANHIKELLTSINDQDFDLEIKQQIIRSTVLLSWSYYCHGSDKKNIPEFSFLAPPAEEGIENLTDEQNNEKMEKAKKWFNLLSANKYHTTDRINLTIAETIEQGFVNKEKLINLCQHKQKEINVQKRSQKLNKAWSIFHDSFDTNENQVISAMEEGLRDVAKTASCHQYDYGINLLRKLGEDDKANELINLFIEFKKETPEAINLNSNEYNPFRDLTDSKFKEELNAAYEKYKPKPTLEEILEKGKKFDGNERVYSAFLAEEYDEKQIVEIFKGFKGKDLTRNVKVFLHLTTFNKKLNKKVDEALRQIAKESKLNAIRMDKFGISTIEVGMTV